jgi:ferredoxin-NADP reductase
MFKKMLGLFGGGGKAKKPARAVPHDLRVREVVRETPDAVTLRFDHPTSGPLTYAPGQYYTVTLLIDGKKVRRSYSISSPVGSDHLALTIKRIGDGVCSTFINTQIKAGDVVSVVGPHGTFTVDPEQSGHELVLIAGGSGITPMMSITETLLRGTVPCSITLIYGNRSAADVIFAQRLTALAAEHPERFRLRHVLQTPHEAWQHANGMLDEAVLTAELAAVKPSAEAAYYICGPTPMLESAQAVLKKLGVPAKKIFIEKFSSPSERTSDGTAAHQLTVRGGDEVYGVIEVPAGRTLLDAGLDADMPRPFSCTAGQCGDCRVRMLSGSVEMMEPNCLGKKNRENGYILACQSHPTSDVTVDIDDRGEDDD